MANYKLNTEIKDQCTAFMNGLTSIIQGDWLKIFTEQELQIVISGIKQLFNVDDLRNNTIYKGYSSFDTYVYDFWRVFESFTEQEKHLLIKFVTSCYTKG